MAGWCEIEEGDCGEVIGGGMTPRCIGGVEDLRWSKREEGWSERDETGRKRRDGEKAGEIKGGVSEREIIRTSRCNEKI